jgi:hypothetical protein
MKRTKVVLQSFSGTSWPVYCVLTKETGNFSCFFIFAASSGRRDAQFGNRCITHVLISTNTTGRVLHNCTPNVIVLITATMRRAANGWRNKLMWTTIIPNVTWAWIGRNVEVAGRPLISAWVTWCRAAARQTPTSLETDEGTDPVTACRYTHVQLSLLQELTVAISLLYLTTLCAIALRMMSAWGCRGLNEAFAWREQQSLLGMASATGCMPQCTKDTLTSPTSTNGVHRSKHFSNVGQLQRDCTALCPRSMCLYFYLTTLLRDSNYFASNWDKWIKSWKGRGRKRSWPDFEVTSQHLPGGTQKDHENPQ